MPLFDAYCVVEWSAKSEPCQGKESVWYCLEERTKAGFRRSNWKNPPTRNQAIEKIEVLLANLVRREKRVLLGFNFAYSFPAGLADALGLKGPSPWRAIWQELSSLVEDDSLNRNNRLEVAADLNRRLTGGPAPFWGCPARGTAPAHLGAGAPAGQEYRKLGLRERRIVEERVKKAQPVWKIYYSGSTGGLSLTGIPRLQHLISQPGLAEKSCVWPFEWTSKTETALKRGETMIVHAEVYPPTLGDSKSFDDPPGKLRVDKQAKKLAGWDKTDELLDFLNAPLRISSKGKRRAVLEEEGWILGGEPKAETPRET